MLERLGLPEQDAGRITAFIGNGARVLVERTLRLAGASTDPAEVERALAVFLAEYRARLLDTSRPYPGIPDLLARLAAAGVALTVATNKPGALAEELLAGLGLAALFTAVVGGDSLPSRKPDPGAVYVLAERVRMPLAETLLVGDSLVDLATARAAPVAACLVGWGLTAPATLRAAGPDYFAAAPADVAAFVL